MLTKLFKRITGLDKVEQALIETQAKLATTVDETAKHLKAAEDARAAESQAKMTPKERATAKGEPWVAVLDTHVNKDNIRNGFFELDWNPEFVVKLKQEGYGYDGDPDEEIVDRWFKDLARNVLADEGQDTTRGAGYINVRKLASGKSEIE
jgi:hypothetical protein